MKANTVKIKMETIVINRLQPTGRGEKTGTDFWKQ
jgi:hypothetical protein